MSPETWKQFDENPVSHSAAHHLVTIAELHEEYGYARVSDVARRLAITRGSASVTLKRLKQRNLVTEDKRGFLGLSDEGDHIARSVRAKKLVMKALFVDLLGVEEKQAELDTCMIEHLVSDATAKRASRMLFFMQSGAEEAQQFLGALARWEKENIEKPGEFPSREIESLAKAQKPQKKGKKG